MIDSPCNMNLMIEKTGSFINNDLLAIVDG